VRRSAEGLAPAFDLVPLDFSSAPPVERKALEAKKKEKPAENNASPASSQNAADPAAAKKTGKSETRSSKKKEKQDTAAQKDGKKKAADSGKATPAGAGAEDAGPPTPSMIDLRVGHIIEGASLHLSSYCSSSQSVPTVKKHPDADGLYIEVGGICNDETFPVT
jgi:aminoacyl tRNA synthase complex-interacting multifunctional protein 1